MPRVSVIIPVYGVEKYIERCARSLFEQTLDDIEYLFVDDCTPDDSISILNKILEEYPSRKSQVIIHKMEKNSGPALVREWGMLNATGDYIIHCDSDDWVDVDMYRKMYDTAIEENSDYVICDFKTSNGKKVLSKIRGCRNTDKESLIRDMICQKSAVALWNKLIRRDVIEKGIIHTTHYIGEDFLQSINLLLNSTKVAYIAEPFYSYYTNTSSISKTKEKEKRIRNHHHNKINLDLLISRFKEEGIYEKYADCFVAAKWHVKAKLEFNIQSKFGYLRWYSVYPEIHKEIISNPKIPTIKKIKFILIYFRLYPIRLRRK